LGSNRWVRCEPQWFVEDSLDTFTQEIERALWELLVPLLFGLSLMHTKNVTAAPVDPVPALAKRHQRRTGRPLSRYHVLDIEPMRMVLENEGRAEKDGLAKAVHRCRGHFKTYTSDAPLFGRFTGQWWWDSYQRGDSSLGDVKKDYRLVLDEFGASYRDADERPDLIGAPDRRSGDPDLGGRGLRAHAITQNALAEALERAGLVPRSPRAEEPEFDVGWFVGQTVWIGEVKSITPANEERQLRAALAQLLRYRQRLEEPGRPVRCVVVAERQPVDATWPTLLATERIELVWPECFAEALERWKG
jgi:hypothetical protein